jgi:hypothetical protein
LTERAHEIFRAGDPPEEADVPEPSGERSIPAPVEARDTERGTTPAFRQPLATLIGVAPAAPIVIGRPASSRPPKAPPPAKLELERPYDPGEVAAARFAPASSVRSTVTALAVVAAIAAFLAVILACTLVRR